MAQIGIVAMAMHLMLEEGKDPNGYLTYFQEAQVEFLKPVFPGDTVTIKGEKLLWRRAKMRAKVDLYVGETLAVSGILNGMGVRTTDATT
jgi:3-hydroxyacyl-[acyl-carrier-protein] dehydratase